METGKEKFVKLGKKDQRPEGLRVLLRTSELCKKEGSGGEKILEKPGGGRREKPIISGEGG